MNDKPQLVGLREIAYVLGVERQTVRVWRHRGHLPPPEWVVSGLPIWQLRTILDWATERPEQRLRGGWQGRSAALSTITRPTPAVD